MKILRVVLKNLNSLPDADVRLDQEPLASAGLFAITGPTGAGKSTILDAITLALYGCAARYGSQSNPEDMMRRHTGESQASVEFEVRGAVYRAEWHLRRARGKVDAKVQPAKRYVYDAQGAPLAQNVSEANAIIEELTGLNYERFLRSVLLAQGEFAKFLKSTENERAQLLESLTGTEIYSQLGKLAYEQANLRQQELDLRERELGQIVLLTPEERAAKKGEITRVGEELAGLSKQRSTIAERVDQGKRLADLVNRDAEIAEQKRAFEVRRENAQPELEKLHRHRLALPYVADLAAYETLRSSAEKEETALGAAKWSLTTARQQLAAGYAALSQFGQRVLAEADETLANARAESAKKQKAKADVQQWLDEHSVDAQLDAELPEIAGRLAALKSARNNAQAAQKSVDGLTKELADSNRKHGELAAKLVKEETALAAVRQETELARKTLAVLLNGSTSEALAAKRAEISKKMTGLVQLQAKLERRDVAVLQLAKLRKDEEQLQPKLEAASKQASEAQIIAQQKGELLEAKREALALAERIAGLAGHRRELKSGEACPLCGALEHPFAESESAISQELSSAKHAIAGAKKEHDQATKLASQATQALAAATENARMLREQITLAEQYCRAAESETAPLVLEHGLAEASIAAASNALEDLSARCKGIDELLQRIRAAEEALSATEKSALQAEGASEKTKTALASAKEAAEALADRLEKAKTQLAQDAEASEECTKQVSASLLPFGIATPEANGEAETQKRITARSNAYKKKQDELRGAATACEKAELAIANCERESAALCAKVKAFAIDLREAESVNRDPDAVDAILVAWKTLDEAQSGVARLNNGVAAAEVELGAIEKRLKELQSSVAAQREHISKRLAETIFGSLEALRSVCLPETQSQRIEALEKALHVEEQNLAGQASQLQTQIAELRGLGASDGAQLDLLKTELARVEEQITKTTGFRATLEAECAQDTKNRESHAEKMAKLNEDRAKLATWVQIRELIGSADGAKFRRFAQGLSLDVMTRHANKHLCRLSDRYRLQRISGEELNLEIVDLHQASVTRPMSSLSGGETFLASLALALGLSDLAGRNVRIDSLFIDEGFGSLDPETLDIAVSALDGLRLANKTIGVISHVELLKERIPVQIQVEKLPAGTSRLQVTVCN